MGFNKRYYDEEKIKSFAESHDYESFKTYMLNPDACIFDSEAAHKLHKSFVNATEEERKDIHNTLKTKSWM